MFFEVRYGGREKLLLRKLRSQYSDSGGVGCQTPPKFYVFYGHWTIASCDNHRI